MTDSFTSMSLIDKAGFIIHEARHADANYHVKCPTPFLDQEGNEIRSLITNESFAGKLACDDLATGAYGAQAIWLKNLANHCINCSDQEKSEALSIFNQIILRLIVPSKKALVINDK